MELHNTKIDLPKGKREKLVTLLNQRLADAAERVYKEVGTRRGGL